MKLFVVLLAAVALCAGEEIPQIPGDNSHYVEGVSRYIWMPDGDEVPQLVDLHETADESVLNERNGALNAYWLFTRRNPTAQQVIRHNDLNSLRNSNYNGARPLMVIVHGWSNNGHTGMNALIRDAYLAVTDANVIVVDWRNHANSPYNIAVRAVPSVGQFLGDFLTWVFNNAGGNWNNVHLVGFSLGAHVVGNAGRRVGGRASRITGLDPAGPQWGGNSNALRGSDGQYVEAIHTDGRALGIMDPIGNANFYPNGGRNRQPGCGNNSCSHGRANYLFASSIRTNHFNGRQCANLNQAQNNQCTGANLRMGNSILNKRGNGIFGLTTGANWPF
ncbi:pancreatic lipase-related protein 2-like [Epargyreus clarus]|uniref:pancreatic lipase-related protein 2-like n=1 Tax=Epargyreus clarus TaxID=520877 RepID=UPI003C2C68C3